MRYHPTPPGRRERGVAGRCLGRHVSVDHAVSERRSELVQFHAIKVQGARVGGRVALPGIMEKSPSEIKIPRLGVRTARWAYRGGQGLNEHSRRRRRNQGPTPAKRVVGFSGQLPGSPLASIHCS